MKGIAFRLCLLISLYLSLWCAFLISDIDLHSFHSGVAGIQILGAAAGDNAGVSLSGAGDVNGDGIGDYVIGADFASPLGRTNAGISYVIFGIASATGVTVDLNTFKSGPAGFRILGSTVGYEVSNGH